MSASLLASGQRAQPSSEPDRSPPLGRAQRPSDPEPPPPAPGRTLRVLARVLLWTLIGLGALHALLPTSTTPWGPGPNGAPAHSSSDPQSSRSQASPASQLAMATAAAFLREYLTVDGRRSERPGRLKRYLARGADVDDGVLPEPGVLQSTDLVLPTGVLPTKGGMEVTAVAHLLRTRDGPPRDGGTVAFVVPLVAGSGGMAVGGLPRPAPLPVDPSLTARPVALPAALARSTAVAAGQAVVAVLNGDRAALGRLGGGGVPVVRPFPNGWRPVGIAAIRPAGPPATPSAQVLVRARPSVAGIEYLVPVRVSLRPGAGAPIVREVDAGGMP
jgi:hypothetical protein